MHTLLTGEDYDQQIVPLFSRIFDPAICDASDQPFINPAWEAVLIPEEIGLAQAKIKDRDSEKEYLNATILIYRNLAKLIDSRTCDKVYVAQMPFFRDSWIPGPFGATVTVRPFTENFAELDKGANLLFGICDETETWGYANNIDHFSYLGGTPEFMESFYALCGGREVIRQTFHGYDVSTDWPFSFEDGARPAWRRPFDDPDAPVTETLRERFYHSIGWEATPYTEEEIRNSYAD